ncbi:MAG: MBL fold metallo-hydrolase [Saprospiraceae bacterium]|nr:MBL fold metallo-hydrolase [Lewinella sp.]
MKLSVIETGKFKLDGGAMFGVVPKVMWKRINPPDENNLCTWAMRCLLVDTGERRILIDTGMGDKQGEKFRSHFHPHGDTDLLSSLADKGYSPDDVTDVLITHMHFDHVGGAVSRTETGDLVPTFPKAVYWAAQKHLNWALEPNPREAASFLQENIVPLQEAGVLQLIPDSEEDVEWLPGIRLRFVYGHTEAMLLPIITCQGKTLAYCADLIPSSGHLGLPYVMSYDLRPLHTMDEKKRLLDEAVAGNYYLFFEHDPSIACISLKKDDRGRIVMDEVVDAEQIF